MASVQSDVILTITSHDGTVRSISIPPIPINVSDRLQLQHHQQQMLLAGYIFSRVDGVSLFSVEDDDSVTPTGNSGPIGDASVDLPWSFTSPEIIMEAVEQLQARQAELQSAAGRHPSSGGSTQTGLTRGLGAVPRSVSAASATSGRTQTDQSLASHSVLGPQSTIAPEMNLVPDGLRAVLARSARTAGMNSAELLLMLAVRSGNGGQIDARYSAVLYPALTVPDRSDELAFEHKRTYLSAWAKVYELSLVTCMLVNHVAEAIIGDVVIALHEILEDFVRQPESTSIPPADDAPQ